MSHIKNELKKIYSLAQYDGEEACLSFFNLINELEISNFNHIGELYYKFSLLLFENCFFEDSIKNFSKAYNLGYNKKEIKNFIFDHFINPNKAEFEETFNKNIASYSVNHPNKSVNYNDLPFEFIPITDNKYYIFDLINDNFDSIIEFSDSIENINNKFSDILLIDDDFTKYSNVYSYKSINKKIYYIFKNQLKLFSLFKLPNLNENFVTNLYLFETYDLLEKYLKENISVSLPYNIITFSETNKKRAESLLNEVHTLRLVSNNIKNKNTLLTICILENNITDNKIFKTLNHLILTPYDIEIEFLIINNSDTKSSETSTKIELLNDSRINYFETSQNLEFSFAFFKGLQLSSGKFILYLNSGDFLNVDTLNYYMNLLKSNKNLGIVRSGTSFTYNSLEKINYTAGEKSFLNYFLKNNSINGIIYNKEIIKDLDLDKLLYNSLMDNNEFSKVYPHMFIDSFLLLKGDFYSESKILCIENPSSESKNKIDKFTNIDDLLQYSSLKSRILQHNGAIKILTQLELSANILLNSYLSLCWKTVFLVSLVKDKYFDNSYDVDFIKKQLYACCANGIDSLKIKLTQNDQNLLECNIQNYINQFFK